MQTVKFVQKGDMAGLAFGMLFLGALVGGVVYFFALRSRVQSSGPSLTMGSGMRGYGNQAYGDDPLKGTSDLS